MGSKFFERQQSFWEKQSAVVQISFLFIVIIYMLIGSSIFMLIENTFGDQDVMITPKFNTSQEDCLKVRHVALLEDRGARNDDQAVQALIDCIKPEKEDESDPWKSFSTALMFTFTVVTTIGYGHVAPKTPLGRVVCVVYGLIGIPLTMMTVANIGKFLLETAKKMAAKIQAFQPKVEFWRFFDWLTGKKSGNSKNHAQNSIKMKHLVDENGNAGNSLLDNPTMTTMADELKSIATGSEIELAKNAADNVDEEEEPVGDQEDYELSNSVAGSIILIAFTIYIMFGSMLLPLYESEMSFMTAIYFNFVTLTTVGLGDMVPGSASFLWFTMAYVIIGLALTTMAIEIASEYLKKLHYYGRKMANPGSATIWFGGKKMTVKSLMKNLGEMYGIEDLDNMEALTDLVDTAIDKDEHPENYPTNVDEGDDRSVRPGHLRQLRDPCSITYVDSEASDDDLQGVLGML